MTFDFFSGTCSDLYYSDFVFSQLGRSLKREGFGESQFRDMMTSPEDCLRLFFANYAFARRGKDREDMTNIALRALDEVVASLPPGEIVSQENGEAIWFAFDRLCTENHKKSNENQNRGLLQGMVELAQEVHRDNPGHSIATWARDVVKATRRMEDVFLRIVDIRGIGPKTTSTFLRDVTLVFGIEALIDPADRIYVQPVDRWLRLIAPIVVPEEGMEAAADWIVAGKTSKYCRRAKVEAVRFSAGVTYFGQKIALDPERFTTEVAKAIADYSQSWKPRF
jgi:hypothetical protein